jgi:imidazolonepropionase-like amidohydrolase
LIGIEKTVGTLEPGKIADVISIDGDPLEDIRALRNVRMVMKAGTRYDQMRAEQLEPEERKEVVAV